MSAPTVEQRHFRKHGPWPVSECRACAINWQNCRHKQRFDSARAAHAAALQKNIDTDWNRAVVAYRCAYCSLWHMTTARTPAQIKRVRRMRRKVTSGAV